MIDFQDLASQCTVHYVPVGDDFYKNEAIDVKSFNPNDIPNRGRKILVWTSRNCVNYSSVDENSVAFLKLFRNVPHEVKVQRFDWPSQVLQGLKAQNQEYVNDTKSAFKGKQVATTHNFDRFIVTIGDSYLASDDGKIGQQAVNFFMEQLAQKQKSRKEYLTELSGRSTSVAMLQSMMRWVKLTEKQNILNVMVALRKAGINCSAKDSKHTGTCQLVRDDLEEEYNASMRALPLPESFAYPLKEDDYFKTLWGSESLWSGVEKILDSTEKDRVAEFARFTRAVQNGFGLAVEENQSVGDLEPFLSELLFLHSHAEVVRPNSQAQNPSTYQALPLSIFMAHDSFLETVKNGKKVAVPDKSGEKAAAFRESQGMNALEFRFPVRFRSLDEGAMVSFKGFYPIAFLSHKNVGYGLKLKEVKEEELCLKVKPTQAQTARTKARASATPMD